MSEYLSKHRPENENQKNVVDGISIDPELPEAFNMTDHALRDPIEIEDWWEAPYIITESWEDRCESYDEHVMRSENNTLFTVNETRDEYDSKIAEEKAGWLNTYPTGIRYTVRSLDSGAWDRSTWKGNFSSLEDALTMAKTIQKSNEDYETQKPSLKKHAYDLEL